MVKMAASDEDSRSEVSEILASCTSPKKKDSDQNSETSSDPFEVRIVNICWSSRDDMRFVFTEL